MSHLYVSTLPGFVIECNACHGPLFQVRASRRYRCACKAGFAVVACARGADKPTARELIRPGLLAPQVPAPEVQP